MHKDTRLTALLVSLFTERNPGIELPPRLTTHETRPEQLDYHARKKAYSTLEYAAKHARDEEGLSRVQQLALAVLSAECVLKLRRNTGAPNIDPVLVARCAEIDSI